MTDSATFATPEIENEDTGEDLGGLDDLLASLRSDEEPAPKRGRGRAETKAPAKQMKAAHPDSRKTKKHNLTLQ